MLNFFRFAADPHKLEEHEYRGFIIRELPATAEHRWAIVQHGIRITFAETVKEAKVVIKRLIREHRD